MKPILGLSSSNEYNNSTRQSIKTTTSNHHKSGAITTIHTADSHNFMIGSDVPYNRMDGIPLGMLNLLIQYLILLIQRLIVLKHQLFLQIEVKYNCFVLILCLYYFDSAVFLFIKYRHISEANKIPLNNNKDPRLTRSNKYIKTFCCTSINVACNIAVNYQYRHDTHECNTMDVY